MMPTKPMMTFPEAIESCLRQYLGFCGRATLAEFWWWALGITVVITLLSIIERIIFGFGDDSWYRPLPLFGLAIFLPGIAVTTRRLHDIGRSGWWQLGWVAVGALTVIPVAIGGMVYLDRMSMMFSSEGDFSMGNIAPIIVGLVIFMVIWIGLAVWIIWWMVKQGQAGPNTHGPDPRALDMPV